MGGFNNTMKYIVANWKSNKNEGEVNEWFDNFSKLMTNGPISSGCELILCPPAVYLSLCRNLIKKYMLPMLLGAQNISPFNVGAYTGEITASQVREFAQYSIVGHSERRKNFCEDSKMIDEKVKQAKKAGLKSILCIGGLDTPISPDVSIIAYEPINAIGTGHPEESSEAEAIAEGIKSKYGVESFLYGGSVDEKNISSYFQEEEIDGVLVGGASLDALKFYNLIHKALSTS